MGTNTNSIWNSNNLKHNFPSFVGPSTRSERFSKFMLLDMALKVSLFWSYFVKRCRGQGTIPNSCGVE